jgi:threonine/homoserine/homoserine lactone efflux protein
MTLQSYLTHPNRATRFNRISGSIFVGFGLLLAGTENR